MKWISLFLFIRFQTGVPAVPVSRRSGSTECRRCLHKCPLFAPGQEEIKNAADRKDPSSPLPTAEMIKGSDSAGARITAVAAVTNYNSDQLEGSAQGQKPLHACQ